MKNLKLYGPLLWKGFNCLKAAKPPRGKILLFTTQSPGNPGTQFNRPQKDEFASETPSSFEWTHQLGIQRSNHYNN